MIDRTNRTNRTIARFVAPVIGWSDHQLQRAETIAAAQKSILRRLVATMAPLPVGKQFGLDRVPLDERLVSAFRAQVPISTYADHATLIGRVAAGESDVMFKGKPVALAQTSGTTSGEGVGERHIPQNVALLRHHARGGFRALSRMVKAVGGSLFGGQLLMFGGSTSLTNNEHGIPAGDLSGIIAARLPGWVRPFYEPGLDIALESNWERKLERIAERCATQDIRLVSGIPSWCMMLFDRICAERGLSRARVAWPNLMGFIHGGHAITPFVHRLREHLPVDARMFEVYPASEAFIAIGSRAWTLDEHAPPAMELLWDNGVFLEFAEPGSDHAVGAEAIEPGHVYRVLITTPGGLVRYQIGDLAQGVAPGLIRFAGRIKTRISVFGEHVEGFHLDGAITAASSATGAEVSYYHVAPILPHAGDATGAHEWWIEFARAPSDMRLFTETIDQYLCNQVHDYRAHREGQQLRIPQVVATSPGTFVRYLSARGKLGGQHKVPQAWGDRSIADALARQTTYPRSAQS